VTTDEASLSRHDAYDQVEDEFNRVLDESLLPRGPEMLFDMVAELELPPGAVVLDVGCGTGRHSYELARRFGFNVTGVDPILRRLATGEPGPTGTVRFEAGTAEALPAADSSVDLVWCRDVLSLVPDLPAAFREFHRVLKPGGRALAYQMFATDRLEPAEAEWFHPTMGGLARNADPRYFEESIAAAGLAVERRIVLGSEWGEFDQESSGKPARKLLHAARLLRDPERYVRQFGQENYDIALGDCLWHVYRLIGKMSGRVYVLSKAAA
jgi:ubiquinone/menaquinone biosynthesis C-methylase UbiE